MVVIPALASGLSPRMVSLSSSFIAEIGSGPSPSFWVVEIMVLIVVFWRELFYDFEMVGNMVDESSRLLEGFKI
jgi:hypothetical protein